MNSPRDSASLRIAAFGFRSIPPRAGAAGSDHCSLQLFERMAARGHTVVCYNRLYGSERPSGSEYRGIRLVSFRTVNRRGYDTLLHSLKCTFHIIALNTGDIVQIANGGNSLWALVLRLFGKRVYVSQDGIDWKRKTWPWYGRLYLYISTYITAWFPNQVVFDNVYAKEWFEKKFRRQFTFIPSGSELTDFREDDTVLRTMNLAAGDYFLFVGRFVPDKGLHHLIAAFARVATAKKLVLVGGSPHPSEYEKSLRSTGDTRVLFPGFIYGNDVLNLMKNAYAYIQPSEIEGLSPVMLSVMSLGTPLICSDIPENAFVVGTHALTFTSGSADSLAERITFALQNPALLGSMARQARARAGSQFSWEVAVDKHLSLYRGH